MSFKNPYFFLLLIPLIIAIFFVSKNHHRKYFKTNFPLELNLRYTLKVFFAETLSLYIRITILLLLIIALARPQKILRTEIPPTEGVDIMLVMDTSPSMAAIDINPSRIEAAKLNAKEFVSKRKNDRIGITVFGGVSFLTCPLTLDHEAVKGLIDRIHIGMTKTDMTAIGDAILTAANHLKKSKAKSRIMILITDGRSNAGIVQDPVTAAKIVREFDIKIYSIGTAGKGPAKVPTGDPFRPYITIEDDLNEGELMEISRITGGKYFRVTSSEELSRIYSEIDKLEKTKFEIKRHVEVGELYNFFLIPAIILGFLLMIIEKYFVITVP
ncbi:MAG: VWA domain-containing protein [Elusimicrobiota bacterium]